MPGITRHKARNGFDYRLPDGRLVRDLDTLKRIGSLAIPPARTAVWICPYPNGHIQAIGRDKRGRKQYRYHPRWREVRDESKYGKMLAFGRVLPAIRERVEADLRRRGLPRERVLAAVVRLMEATLFRIGNTEYAKANKSYGLTTLRDRHSRSTAVTSIWTSVASTTSGTKRTSMIAVWRGSSRTAETYPATNCSNTSTTRETGIRSTRLT